MAVTRPNQVWSTNITYRHGRHGRIGAQQSPVECGVNDAHRRIVKEVAEVWQGILGGIPVTRWDHAGPLRRSVLMAQHDSSYKLLFSRRKMVADLIRACVHEDWAERLDLDTLQRVRESGITQDLREREDDVI